MLYQLRDHNQKLQSNDNYTRDRIGLRSNKYVRVLTYFPPRNIKGKTYRNLYGGFLLWFWELPENFLQYREFLDSLEKFFDLVYGFLTALPYKYKIQKSHTVLARSKEQ